MSNRIYFNAWGINDLRIPTYAVADPNESRAARVATAIARKNRLEVITVRSDGTALAGDGKPSHNHYHATLGHSSLYSDGWTITNELWFAIPIAA